jgi:hypothetical protein
MDFKNYWRKQRFKSCFSAIIYTAEVRIINIYTLKVVCRSYFDETNFQTDLHALIYTLLPSLEEALICRSQAAASHSITRCNHGIDQIGISNEFTVSIISIIPT